MGVGKVVAVIPMFNVFGLERASVISLDFVRERLIHGIRLSCLLAISIYASGS